jgi:hypothetical protein
MGFQMRVVKKMPRALLLLALWAGSAEVLASGSMRCGARLVEEEDLAAELLAACGEPSFRDPFALHGPNGGLYIDTEVWTYDFGPQKLLRLVTLRNGQISQIETDGYGFTPSAAPPRCEPRRVVEGLSKYRLVMLCGEPVTKRSENSLRPLYARPEIYRGEGGTYAYRNQYVTPVYREEWVYNFGSRSPMRRVILEDGRVTDVETIDRGFDR